MIVKKDWIKQKLVENDFNRAKVAQLYDTFMEDTDSSWSRESFMREIRRVSVELAEDNEDIDFSEDVIKLEASNQKLTDLNNSLRKVKREGYRLYSSLEEVYKEYVEVLNKVDLGKVSIKSHKIEAGSKIGVLQISDNHLNEVIYEHESHGNAFDFNIASKRLKKFVSKSIKYFDDNKVKECYIFFTGDLINSNRRISERLAQNSSLVRASLLATYLYQQVIIELSGKYNVHVAYVVGNESRLEEYMDSSDILASENWDYLIYNNLRLIFRDKPIDFMEGQSNIHNVVTLKNGFNALLTHGHIFKSSNTVEKNISMLLQNYIYKGIKIHGVFYGHYHSASIGDFVSRSGSLCGANSYSAIDLNYLTRASQNAYIIENDLSYTGIKIDLQNTDGIEGYRIIEELEHYNVDKSASNNSVTIKNLV